VSIAGLIFPRCFKATVSAFRRAPICLWGFHGGVLGGQGGDVEIARLLCVSNWLMDGRVLRVECLPCAAVAGMLLLHELR